MSNFLKAYLRRGFSDIRIVGREFRQNVSGDDEVSEERVVARIGKGFLLATFLWAPGALGFGNDKKRLSTFTEPALKRSTKSWRTVEGKSTLRKRSMYASKATSSLSEGVVVAEIRRLKISQD